MQMEILFKKCGISNPPDACIRDNPCLSKFGHTPEDTESDANIR